MIFKNMNRLARAVAAVDKIAVKVVSAAAALAFLGITVLVTYTVFMRFLFRVGTAWAEELPLLFNIWFSMLAAPLVFRYNGHVAVSFFVQQLPMKCQNIINKGTNLLISGFGCFLIIYSRDLVARFSAARMATVNWPLAVMYIPVIICGGLLTFWGILAVLNQLIFKNELDNGC